MIFGLIITLRFFYIQVLRADSYSDEISNLTKYNKTIKGERGNIYDRNGMPLAENITKGDFWVNTNKSLDANKIAGFFYNYFNSDCTAIIDYIKRKKTAYLPIKKNIVLENIDEIDKRIRNIKGLYLDKYSHCLSRKRPHKQEIY